MLQTTSVLLIMTPFRELENGDAVTLYAGCDHTAATCLAKFDNLVNFGGCPAVPEFNPFAAPIKLGGG